MLISYYMIVNDFTRRDRSRNTIMHENDTLTYLKRNKCLFCIIQNCVLCLYSTSSKFILMIYSLFIINNTPAYVAKLMHSDINIHRKIQSQRQTKPHTSQSSSKIDVNRWTFCIVICTFEYDTLLQYYIGLKFPMLPAYGISLIYVALFVIDRPWSSCSTRML